MRGFRFSGCVDQWDQAALEVSKVFAWFSSVGLRAWSSGFTLLVWFGLQNRALGFRTV